MDTPDELPRRLARPAYPRSAGYDPRPLMKTAMGPNPLWLMEALTQALPLARAQGDLDLIRADRGRTLCFARAVARAK